MTMEDISKMETTALITIQNRNNMKNKIQVPQILRLPLKTKWFEMTKAGIKTEDYREINDYWTTRLVSHWQIGEAEHEGQCWSDTPKTPIFKKFNFNLMFLGYPKSTDADRVLKLKHKGIQIRTGNPDWGAEPNKLYFVILHGDKV